MPKDSPAPADVDLLADQRWRISNLYSVRDKDGRVRPFKPNGAQAEFLGAFHRRNIILKARQLGFTTLSAIYFLDACIWRPNTSALIIAHKQDDASAIFKNKIKWVWDRFCEEWPHLVEQLGLTAVNDSASELALSNGSSLRVALSGRSGTFQLLLVTEFGKMCAQYPQRAEEVVTGAFNAVPRKGVVIIESTAEGQDGHFYKMSREAQAITPGRDWPEGEDDFEAGPKRAPRKLGGMDYKFHFFPWWGDKSYVENPAFVAVTDDDDKYFDDLETKLDIVLTPSQRAWYAKKAEEQGGAMRREYPSYPAEAFESALEGCVLEDQILAAKRRGRIGVFPIAPGVPVNTFWDLGRADATAIWLHQQIGERHRFVGYYENSGEHISHYARWLNEWLDDNQAHWGQHYAPHDAAREDLFLEHGRKSVAERAGIRFRIVSRVANKMEGVEASRGVFPRCDFDQRGCGLGLKRLRAFRKVWDAQRQCFTTNFVHDENSHGYDAFETFARGYRAPAGKNARGSQRRRQYTGGLV